MEAASVELEKAMAKMVKACQKLVIASNESSKCRARMANGPLPSSEIRTTTTLPRTCGESDESSSRLNVPQKLQKIQETRHRGPLLLQISHISPDGYLLEPGAKIDFVQPGTGRLVAKGGTVASVAGGVLKVDLNGKVCTLRVPTSLRDN